MTTFFALSISVVVTSLLLGMLLRLAPRTGLMDYPGDRRRLHREAVPRIGGLAVFAGILASLGVSPALTPAQWYGLAGAALLILVGAIDDRHQLGAQVRLVAQIGAGLLLTLGEGAVISSLGNLLGTGQILLGAWAVPFTLLAIVGMINALNMIDGIDGLAGGITAIALGSLLFFIPAGSALHLLLSSTLAALVPYLICNLKLGCCRCQVFLGDAGSMLLGYLIVWGMIEVSQSTGGIAPVTAIWLTAVPLMDTLASIGRRLSNGRHPFNPDRTHLHHCLSRLLHSTRKALILLLLLAALLAGIGLGGQALAVPEALMFFTALAFFSGHLWLTLRMRALHRNRLKHDRQLTRPSPCKLPE